MSDASQRTNLTGWALLLIGAAGLVWMVIVMMGATGDLAYEAQDGATVRAAPDDTAAVLTTLAAGDRLQCHGESEDHPGWNDCSDMLERKYVRYEALKRVTD